MLSLILSTFYACWASSHWFNLVPKTWTTGVKHATYLVENSIVVSDANWGADVNCAMSGVESPIVAARISLIVLWTNADVMLSC